MSDNNNEIILLNQLQNDLEEYISKTYEKPQRFSQAIPFLSDEELLELEKKQEQMNKNFLETLFSYIDKKGITDTEAYKLSNIDRKAFSKIKSGVTKRPSKDTILSFSIGLNLTIDETNNLLNTAEYSLSNSFKRDIIIKYCIGKKLTVDQVNTLLEYYNENKLNE